MMDELAIIENKIYEIRGQKVMLDFDLAEMYGVETRVLKQAVRRNIERFPIEFMFELTKEEDRFRVLKCSDNRAIKILNEEGKKFDLIFLDPPYAKQKIVKIMTKLLENDLLNDNALIVAETDEHDELPEVSGFSIIKDHQLGRTKVKVYKRK